MPMLVRLLLSALVLCGLQIRASAQTSDAREMEDAIGNAYKQGTVGPATIQLGEIATLQLRKDLVFVPVPAADRLLQGKGLSGDGSVLGVVIPSGHYANWFMTIAVRETGHVSNSALAGLDAGDIRATYAAAVRRGNAARMQMGSGPLDAGALLETPKHDAATHRYATAIRVFESGPSSGDEDIAKVDAYAFGRSHMVQVSLVDSLPDHGKRRAAFDSVVEGVSFVSGQRAQDLVAGRDPVATRVLDIVFGGRTVKELAAEAAEEAAEAKRIAALPQPQSISTNIKLAFFGALGLLSVLAGVLAFAWRGGNGNAAVQDNVVDRALRTGRR